MKIVDKNGVRYAKPYASLHVVISTEILSLEGMTGPIMTSCLLHEIGHNFFFESGYSYMVSGLEFVIKLLKQAIKNPGLIPQVVASLVFSFSKTTKLVLDTMDKSMCRTPVLRELNIVMNTISGTVESMINNFMMIIYYLNPISVLTSNIKSSIIHLLKLPLGRSGYRNEQFADNFATAYGYGKEVIQLQEIFSKTNAIFALDFLAKNKFCAAYIDLLNCSRDLLGGFTDVHPSTVSRMIDQINYLEEQLDEIQDKNMKKKMKKDLAVLKKQYSEFAKDVNDGKYKKAGKIVSSAMMKSEIKNGGNIAYKYTKKGRNKKGQWDALPDQI